MADLFANIFVEVIVASVRVQDSAITPLILSSYFLPNSSIRGAPPDAQVLIQERSNVSISGRAKSVAIIMGAPPPKARL